MRLLFAVLLLCVCCDSAKRGARRGHFECDDLARSAREFCSCCSCCAFSGFRLLSFIFCLASCYSVLPVEALLLCAICELLKNAALSLSEGPCFGFWVLETRVTSL